jgi:hypothetical protein
MAKPQNILSDKQAPTTTVTFYVFTVLVRPHLPRLKPLVGTPPAYKHLLASHTPHKLNGRYKAWHRIIVSTGQ